MISGKSPSGPEAGSGGKATLTSIGTPSKALLVLRGLVLPQKRTPSACTAQLTSPLKTLVIVGVGGRGEDQPGEDDRNCDELAHLSPCVGGPSLMGPCDCPLLPGGQ